MRSSEPHTGSGGIPVEGQRRGQLFETALPSRVLSEVTFAGTCKSTWSNSRSDKEKIFRYIDSASFGLDLNTLIRICPSLLPLINIESGPELGTS